MSQPAEEQPGSTAEELEHWRARALAAERWRDEVWSRAAEHEAQAERAEALARRLAEIESSSFWKAIAPLRLVTARLRRLRRRLAER